MVLWIPLIGITVWVVKDAGIGGRRRRGRHLLVIGIGCCRGTERFGGGVSRRESRDFY